MASVAGIDLGALKWVKSSGSAGDRGYDGGGSDGECVRLARWSNLVLVDDSKSPSPEGGGVLAFDSRRFYAFLHHSVRSCGSG
jgi:hypothetical protein